MTDNTTAPPVGDGTSLANGQGNDTPLTGRQERERELERLWLLTVKALADGIENPERADKMAAWLNAARQFLADNKTSNETLDRIGSGKNQALAKVLDQLPERDGSGEAEPIRPLYDDKLPPLPDP